MAAFEQTQPILQLQDPTYNGDSKSARIVSAPQYISFVICQCVLDSVSSVKTLEEAKAARGCFYMQIPVQDVSVILSIEFQTKMLRFSV